MAPRRGKRTKPRLETLQSLRAPESMASWAQRYIEWLRIKNYSPRTVDNRESYLTLFLAWCEERSILSPQEVTKLVIERYQRHLFYFRRDNGKPLTFQAQSSRLVPLREYFKWLARRNVVLYNPAADLELPRIEQRLPKHVLTASEAEAVLRIPDIDEPLGLRDRAMLEVLYATGIRRSELLRLTVYDIDRERGTLTIRQGKGKKDRVVPLGERAGAWVDKYIHEARKSLVMEPDEGGLFLTNVGDAFSAMALSELVRRYVAAADLGKTGSCHLFRHTCATLMLEGGADVRYIQAMLGHARLDTTMIYTRVGIRTLTQIHAATHPGARLMPLQSLLTPHEAPPLVAPSRHQERPEDGADEG